MHINLSSFHLFWALILPFTLIMGEGFSGEGESGFHLRTVMERVPLTAKIEDEGWHVWGASMVRTEDGVCHLFYARWPKPFSRWKDHSEIAYATASDPFGPYTFQGIALGRRGADWWDGVSVYNPTVLRLGKKYYLYYAGNNGAIRSVTSPSGTTLTQRVGVAVAATPSGPWERMDAPLLAGGSESVDSDFSCNPSVVQRPCGDYLMLYKCGALGSPRVHHAIATANSPTGPFEKRNRPIFTSEGSRFPAEDPFLWYQGDRYYCILKDMSGEFSKVGRSLVQFESKDGFDWKPSTPVLVCKPVIHWADGSKQIVEFLERPQIWLDGGRPAVLFLAAKTGDSSFNVQIPLGHGSDCAGDKQ